jgi:hypothetical protein
LAEDVDFGADFVDTGELPLLRLRHEYYNVQ